MNSQVPLIYLVRHGETAWTISGQHTGLTDLPLTPLGERLKGLSFDAVFASPLQRALRTCELAGFGTGVQIDRDLVEWDYGVYEGKTTDEIRRERPCWDLFLDGCPHGESVSTVSTRADGVIRRLRGINGSTLLFSSGHFLRVLAVRWLGLHAAAGRYLLLGTGALSILGYEHDLQNPVIHLWNDRYR
ncbi:MAG TPA: histidine phosphatase family protein [Bryobacteraceae bacterium]